MAIIPAAAARLAPAAGAAATDLAVRAIRPALCGLYRQNPGWYTGSPSALGRDIGRVASFALDNLCSDQPLPPPQVVPFQGGQCRSVLYRCTFRITNPTTGVTSTFVAIHAGSLGGVGIERIGTDTDGVAINRYFFVHSISPTNPNGTRTDLSNGRVDRFLVSLEGVARQDGLPDVCGNPPPSDPPAPVGDSVSVNINLPDLRVSPTANIVIPVVIFKPQFNINPQLNVEMKINFDFGGQKIVFDGSDFRTGNDVDIDFTSVNNQITNTQNNINTNTNTQISNSQTNINNNTNNARNSINTNTNNQIANTQTNINTSTVNAIANNNSIINNAINTSLTTTQNNINTNTNTSVTNLSRDINASLNVLKADLTAQLQFVANLTGIINADVKIALEFLRTINDKPDCPELPPPPDEVPAPPDEKPPDDGGDSPPKKRLAYVEVVLTKLPDKVQFGNRGAQNVYFAGWLSFRSPTGSYHERQQINFQKSIFTAPLGSDGYTYTLTHGARGTIKEYYI